MNKIDDYRRMILVIKKLVSVQKDVNGRREWYINEGMKRKLEILIISWIEAYNEFRAIINGILI